MHIAIDMQGALTHGSRPRGIGRYTSQLVKAMAGGRRGHRLTLMLNDNHAEAAAEVAAEEAGRGLGTAVTRYAVPLSPSIATSNTAPVRQVADAIVRRHVATLEPDVLLVTSIFEQAPEDFSPADLRRYPGKLKVAILYDLIPLVFERHYLENPLLRATYYEMVATLKSADLLLAISDSARRDAIRLLGADPERVVNVSAAADDTFRPLDLSAGRRADLGERLGLTRPFVVYVAGADMRKNLAGAVEVFAALPEAVRGSHQLLLVTRLDPEGARRIHDHAEKLGLAPDALVLARDVGGDDLVAVMNLARALVFPSLYEGFGLPVLEAMQCGTPVVAARTSSIPELIDRDDLLFPAGDAAAGARALAPLLTDADLHREVAAWGLGRAADFTWRHAADRALDAIERHAAAVEGTRPAVLPCTLRDIDGTRAELADIVAEAPDQDDAVEGFVAKLMVSVPEFGQAWPRRLLVDVTDCRRNPAWTGIQRVVRKLTSALYDQAGADRPFIPLAVRLDRPEPESALDFVAATLGRPTEGRDYPVEIRAGDDLFMLDSNWTAYPGYGPLFDEINARGGRLFTCIYDIIPELHPEVCGEGMPQAHSRWLHAAIARSDGLICISRAVADEVALYLTRLRLPHRPGLKIGWFHCGSDIRDLSNGTRARPDVVEAFAGDRPTFLVVGTLEPRKAHALALDAFDDLWARGADVALCFIGARGWKVGELENRIRTHPEHGRRLFWFLDARDADVSHAYVRAEAILAPSMAEGFGLPIAEAARMGRPVICSDIPVFREVGGDGAVYFRSGDPSSLAAVVEDWVGGRLVADPTKVSRNSWDDAAARIAEIIVGDDWYLTLPAAPAAC